MERVDRGATLPSSAGGVSDPSLPLLTASTLVQQPLPEYFGISFYPGAGIHRMVAHVNPPKQSRSRRTLERIVRASMEILEEAGPDGLTVKAIVRRADSSVGSFYARFEGKEDLLEYLGERVWTEAAERWDRRLAERDWSGLELAGLVEGAVGLMAEASRSRASYLRALNQASAAGDAFSSFRSHVLGGVASLLLERRDEMGHPEPELAVEVGLRAVVGLLDAAEQAGWRAPRPATLTGEASRLLRSYLTPGQESDRVEEDVDFFDVWG